MRRVERFIHLMFPALTYRLYHEIGLPASNERDLVIELSDHRLERTGDQRLQAKVGGQTTVHRTAIIVRGGYARNIGQGPPPSCNRPGGIGTATCE